MSRQLLNVLSYANFLLQQLTRILIVIDFKQPDGEIGSTLNAVGFDAVYVQFCMSSYKSIEMQPLIPSPDNNFCGLTNYNNPNAWNYAQWYWHSSHA